MKKNYTLFLFLVFVSVFAQQKSTGVVNLSANMQANLTLDNSNSTATLALSGPNDRWFALQFGSFVGGMEMGSDLVYWNGTTLVDAVHNGQGSAPTVDGTNNWTLVSNVNNIPSVGLRTVVFTRPFNTSDTNDFTFNFSDTTIDLAWARYSSASFIIDYHGNSNRGVSLNVPLNTLGLNEFTLKNSKIFPNPSKGNFTISTNTHLDFVDVYSINGSLIKSYEVTNKSENVVFNISNLPTGVYFLQLKNDSETFWKKIIIE